MIIHKHLRQVAAVAVLLTFLASCGRPNMGDYLAVHKDGLVKLTAANQIDDHYTQVDHFITHFGFGQQPLEWNTEAFIEGRFTLTVQIPVTVDYSKHSVAQSGEPKFYLHATESVLFRPDGTLDGCDFDAALQRHFGQAEWDKFVRSGFDLTSLGILREQIRGVAHFDEYVRACRRPRVPVK